MSSSHGLSAQALFDVSGYVALVTGGGTGIGLMIAEGLASNGAIVYIAARRMDVVSKAAEAFDQTSGGGKLVPLELDVIDKTSISKAVARIQQEHGRLDALVNNAGQVGPVSEFISDRQSPENASADSLGKAVFDSESFEQWSNHFTVNVSSIFFVTMAFLGLLEAGANARPNHGSAVINIGSISGLMTLNQGHFCYNSGKAAVHHLTKMLATEFGLKGHKIRVNAIAPGLFLSELVDPGDKHIDEVVDKLSGSLIPVPAKRAGRPSDMAACALYLASAAGSYVNGQILVPDGGWVAVNP
ncbi:hypothetical protein FRB94_011734 [Tulasnella sp. JGI-2019a]|nr:hypothetical protein FRB94_011734 [Tulasnella sp. JGI-2019a]KAG9010395.1 hypothetical protein FRB93_004235 [Tulasnella sp. JGI-2019a]